MLTNPMKSIRSALIYGVLSLLVVSVASFGQDQNTDPGQNQSTDPGQNQPPAPGWHRFSAPPQIAPPVDPAPPAVPTQQIAPTQQAAPAPPSVPERITIPAGTFVTVRVDQFLSSDKSKPGDQFSATLARPLVADGLVVSRRGEMLGGRVVDAKKAGRVKGVSHLQIVLNSLTLADGQQVPVETELTNITGPTSKARDAGAIITTTAAGAAIGGAVAWGPGAAMGAGAGLIASTVGVLATRGRPTVIPPEAQLTFRLAVPVTFSTDRAPQAFVDASTLNNQRAANQAPPLGPRPPAYVGAPGPYPYYPYPYYPYYWGPSLGFYFGPGFYGRGFYRR